MSKQDTPNIHRELHDKDHPFLCVSRGIPQNKDLSFEARGMLMYILSQKDTWVINLDDLQQGCGRDKARRILNELIDAKHIIPGEQIRNKKGRFVIGTPPQVYETPHDDEPVTDKPCTDNQEMDKIATSIINTKLVEDTPYTEKPLTVNQYTENPTEINNKIISSEEINNVKEKEIASDDADTDSQNSDSTQSEITPFAELDHHKKISACIKAWLDGQKAIQAKPKNEYQITTNRNIMTALLDNGVVPDDITRFMAIKAKPDWFVSITALNNSLLGWLKEHPAPKPPEPEPEPIEWTQADQEWLDEQNGFMQNILDQFVARNEKVVRYGMVTR